MKVFSALFALAACGPFASSATLTRVPSEWEDDVHGHKGSVENLHDTACHESIPKGYERLIRSLLGNESDLLRAVDRRTEGMHVSPSANMSVLVRGLAGAFTSFQRYLESSVLGMHPPQVPRIGFSRLPLPRNQQKHWFLHLVQTPLFERDLVGRILNASKKGSLLQTARTPADVTPLNGSKARIVFINYHKTGTVFTSLLMPLLAAWQDLDICDYVATEQGAPPVTYAHGSSIRDMWSSQIIVKDGSVSRLSHPTATWVKPPRAKLIHWYRNPALMILSAFRYHSAAESAEPWETTTTMCHMCDKYAAKAIFETCGYQCSYFEFLSTASTESGLAAEALNARQTINAMVSNLLRWRNDPNVLHTTVDSMGADFKGTMSCMLRFLDLEPSSAFVDLVEAADAKHRTATNDRHATKGKFDNSVLDNWLTSHPVWGAEFEVVKYLEKAVFTRQHEQFGCPVSPEFYEGMSNTTSAMDDASSKVKDATEAAEKPLAGLPPHLSFVYQKRQEVERMFALRRMVEDSFALDALEESAGLSFT